MGTLVLIILLIVAIPAVWWIIKPLLAVTTPPERSGLLLLKHELKKLGVDVARVPDSALNENVQRSIANAKATAELYAGSRLHNAAEYKSWRANIVRGLELQARAIQEIMSGYPFNPLNEPTQEIQPERCR